jgi:hypothetical protein
MIEALVRLGGEPHSVDDGFGNPRFRKFPNHTKGNRRRSITTTASCQGVGALAEAAAWEVTMNSNDFPSTLNFILFLSSVNWIAVFNEMRV